MMRKDNHDGMISSSTGQHLLSRKCSSRRNIRGSDRISSRSLRSSSRHQDSNHDAGNDMHVSLEAFVKNTNAGGRAIADDGFFVEDDGFNHNDYDRDFHCDTSHSNQRRRSKRTSSSKMLIVDDRMARHKNRGLSERKLKVRREQVQHDDDGDEHLRRRREKLNQKKKKRQVNKSQPRSRRSSRNNNGKGNMQMEEDDDMDIDDYTVYSEQPLPRRSKCKDESTRNLPRRYNSSSSNRSSKNRRSDEIHRGEPTRRGTTRSKSADDIYAAATLFTPISTIHEEKQKRAPVRPRRTSTDPSDQRPSRWVSVNNANERAILNNHNISSRLSERSRVSGNESTGIEFLLRGGRRKNSGSDDATQTSDWNDVLELVNQKKRELRKKKSQDHIRNLNKHNNNTTLEMKMQRIANADRGRATSERESTKHSRASFTSRDSSDSHRSGTSNPVSIDSSNTQNTKASVKAIYRYARKGDWERVCEVCSDSPEDARYIDEKTGFTPLHLAIISRLAPSIFPIRQQHAKKIDNTDQSVRPASLDTIEKLLRSAPEVAIIRCSNEKYTPLMYACLVTDSYYDIEDATEIVHLLLDYSPECISVYTDQGLSALDVHIMSFSHINGKYRLDITSKPSLLSQMPNNTPTNSTRVLETLLHCSPQLADVRLYKTKCRGPLELLFRCNTEAFEEAAGFTDDDDSDDSDPDECTFFGDNEPNAKSQNLLATVSNWWVWNWAILLLKYASRDPGDPHPNSRSRARATKFNHLSAASQLLGCPVPIITIALRAYPKQIHERNPKFDLYNLPIHDVCGWECDDAIIHNDPMILSRKSYIISLLVDEHPQSARMTNNLGETPLEIAILSGTPWMSGIAELVELCPKALNYQSKETGFYPFMSAAFASAPVISESSQFLLTEEGKKQYKEGFKKKKLESLQTTFGLLRANPNVLINCLKTSHSRKTKRRV